MLLIAAKANATTQPFYFHYSSGGVTIPSGADPHYYMNATAPTATTPVVTSAIGISRDDTEPLPVFTSTALSAITLEKFATVTINISANGTMTGCAGLAGTLEHVTAGGAATTIGQALEKNVTIPAGTGGGLVGYEAIPLRFALDVEGRQIPSGDSLRVRTFVTNSCASNRSVRLVFDGTVTTDSHSRAEFSSPDIALFGPPGKFGTYDGLVSGTATIATGYDQDWGVDAGLTYFYSTVAPSDGTVFSANFFTSFSPWSQTSCSTVVTCFNPDAPTCNDENDEAAHYTNIRLPDDDGNVFSPTTATPNTCPPPDRGGVDIADVELIEDDGEHVQFISSRSSAFSENAPAFGRLHKTGGKWDIESLLYPSDIGPDCPDGQCEFVNEVEQLPGSGHVVYAQYFRNGSLPNASGVIYVTDAAGNLKAWSYQPSQMEDQTGCGLGLKVTAKTVEVDPSSAASCGQSGCSDERFLVQHDNFTFDGNPSTAEVGRSFTFQEFRYDTTQDPPVLEPVTPALFVKSPVGHAPQVNSAPCGLKDNGTIQGLGGWYDTQGNLWVPRAASLVDVFLKDPTTGKRRIETDSACRWAGHENDWGVTCAADLEFPDAEATAGFVDDPVTGNVLYVGNYGKLIRFAPSTTGGGAPTFVRKTTALNLSIGAKLPVLGFEVTLHRPSFDPERRMAWTGTRIQAAALPGRPHWIYAIDVPRIMSYP